MEIDLGAVEQFLSMHYLFAQPQICLLAFILQADSNVIASHFSGIVTHP